MRGRKIVRTSVAVLMVGALSFLSAGPSFREHVIERVRASSGTAEAAEVGDGEVNQSKPGDVIRTRRGGSAVGGLECGRGRNGGATDVGVTGSSIKLAATVVKTGVGSSFLGEVPIALEAVKNRVNRAGGVCGRLLELEMVDDRWDANEGLRNIRKFIAAGTFALAVSPSSQGLDAAIRNGDISRAGIPVVGADGMLISQYTDPWVWAVAASTITTMHVMAKDAAERGAGTFGLVYDQSYHFGVEGASGFRGALSRIFPGGRVLRSDIGVDAGQPSYKNEVQRFNTECASCDFVAMLLEPPTALQWIRDGGRFGNMEHGGTGGPQPLLVNSFARACGAPCGGMWVWTGYTPPIYPFDADPGVTRFVNDIRAQSSVADVNNPFVQGGYLGMELLVEGLRQVGPNLTRARLRSILDGMTIDRGLSQPLTWREGDHFANNSAQAFSIVVNAGSFSSWRYEQTGWVVDPWPGLDAPKR